MPGIGLLPTRLLTHRSRARRSASPRLSSALLLTLAVCGCGESEDGSTSGGGAGSCLPPSRLVGDQCREPGEQDDGCPAGSWLTQEDVCQPAGIAPEACTEGFVPTDAGGCDPILPAAPCPPGLMALPGDTECHEIMACGAGPWGDIPVDSTTVYVDQSYDLGAGPSDGTESRPFTTVGEAVDTAPGGALIAVAPGSYVEDLEFADRAVRLWGKCPAEVELVSTGEEYAQVTFWGGASGSELAGLAIRGPAHGVGVFGAEDLDLHALWIHDNGLRGIAFDDVYGPTSASVSTCLIEDNHELGFFVGGAAIDIEGVVVRDTQPSAASQMYGRGINIRDNPTTDARATVSARAMVIENNHELGLFIAASDVELDAIVVRGTLPQAADQTGGQGMAFQPSPESSAPANVGLRHSVIHNNCDDGLLIMGSDVAIDSVTIRDTLASSFDQAAAYGLAIQPDEVAGSPSKVSVHGALIQHTHGIGVFTAGSDVELDAVIVRDTFPQPSDQRYGTGVLVQPGFEWAPASTLLLRASLIDNNHVGGVVVLGGAKARLLGVRVLHTMAQVSDGLYGDGVVAAAELPGTTVDLSSCHIGDSARAGHSLFAAASLVQASSLSCNAFHLAAEPQSGHPAEFTDGGGNHCSCNDQDQICKAVSAGLSPPAGI